MKTYQVNYLLAIARMPDRFYAMINGLKGRDADYKNPGVSLRSFVVAHYIRHEVAHVPTEMLEVVQECYEFSSNAEIIANIKETLIKDSQALLDVISELPRDQFRKLEKFVRPLSELTGLTKMSFDTFIMSQDPAKDRADILTPQGTQLKAAMFDLQDAINEANYALSLLPSPKELA